ncbi:MAG TPA: RecX family transcriptional regulator [bacterium]|nr:RecX family transcriptional regulator [bacterium]HPN31176.1 RecX family transcriptional regulator [bacterium]
MIRLECEKISRGKIAVKFSDNIVKILSVRLYDKLCITGGREISDSEEKVLIEKIDYFLAEEIALRKIKIRKRSEFEIESELKKNGINKYVIGVILEKLKSLRLIDDSDFAASYINDQIKFNKKSLKKIKLELFQKKIGRNIIEEALSRYKNESPDSCGDIETCKKLILKKTADNPLILKNNKELKSKIIRYLLNKGFDFDAVKKSMNLDGNDFGFDE